MRIRYYLADQHPRRDRSLGITSYTDGLLRTLSNRPDVAIEAVTSASSYQPPSGRVRRLPFSTDRTAARLFADHIGLRLVSGQPDVWHFPKGYLGALGRPRAPVVLTVHDVILAHNARHHAGSRSRLAFRYWLGLTRRSLAAADHVITVSEHARGQIAAFAHDAHVPLPPITVTYQGARGEARAGEPAGTKGDYVLHLGSTEPHKQTTALLTAWEVLWTRRRAPRLVVVGRIGSDAEFVARRSTGVQLMPAAESGALDELMRRALALILPSEIEGFGLPALEAYYQATPVAYVRGTAVDEVLAGAPGAFDLADVDSLQRAVDVACALTPEQVAVTARSLRERFAWTRCADRTLAVYQSVLGV